MRVSVKLEGLADERRWRLALLLGCQMVLPPVVHPCVPLVSSMMNCTQMSPPNMPVLCPFPNLCTYLHFALPPSHDALHKAYADYNDMMELTEEVIVGIAEKCLGTTELEYGGTPISLARPWRRVPMHDLVAEATGVDFAALPHNEAGLEEAKAKAREAGVRDVDKCPTVGSVVNVCFEELCEPNLIQPTFVLDYPKVCTSFCFLFFVVVVAITLCRCPYWCL